MPASLAISAQIRRKRLRGPNSKPIPARMLEGSPNSLAYAALFAWPLISVILFVQLPVEKAAIWSLFGGWLLLPSATVVNPPLVPPLDKFSIPAVSTFLLCCMKGSQLPAPKRSMLIYALATVWTFAPLLSSLNNSYEIQIGDRSLPGFYPPNALKIGFDNLIRLLPFFIGMRFLSTDRSRALLLKALPSAALFYSVPMLFEVRMSPQLHKWVYGFFPHSFVQQYRDGGFRPVVFMGHGLEVALFTSLAVMACLVMRRAKWQIFRQPASLAAGYLAVVLVFCKTWGANIYLIIAAPILWFTRPRTWVRISIVLTLLVCAYPVLRNYDIVPVHRIMDLANSINPARAASFNVRVKNEDILLDKANQKPFFGWGADGRNRVYEAVTGEDISVTDGEWIITYGSWGWVGYLSYFGLFAAAMFIARRGVRGPVTENSVAIGGLSLLAAINVADLIPNASLLPFSYLAAGSVAAGVHVRATKKFARRPVKTEEPAPVPA